MVENPSIISITDHGVSRSFKGLFRIPGFRTPEFNSKECYFAIGSHWDNDIYVPPDTDYGYFECKFAFKDDNQATELLVDGENKLCGPSHRKAVIPKASKQASKQIFLTIGQESKARSLLQNPRRTGRRQNRRYLTTFSPATRFRRLLAGTYNSYQAPYPSRYMAPSQEERSTLVVPAEKVCYSVQQLPVRTAEKVGGPGAPDAAPGRVVLGEIRNPVDPRKNMFNKRALELISTVFKTADRGTGECQATYNYMSAPCYHQLTGFCRVAFLVSTFLAKRGSAARGTMEQPRTRDR
ncbi:hypothetical protein B0T24DRAFT_593883 [Lasiosphaeria ovina]|uniref:Uncharacterized protein n=1 Tax=Lasiosphaeria ovina TaxID=92902 RepID=A0AAE0N7J9_9PEZI|nr:hypothetical protein B0T24DRAFT_593883 [Lasiosphaeria ovina]